LVESYELEEGEATALFSDLTIVMGKFVVLVLQKFNIGFED
jgi:hypothetical protein